MIHLTMQVYIQIILWLGNMVIKVIEQNPNGKNSIQSATDWMSDISKKSDNTKPLWKELTPEIRQAVKYEFSPANPNNWKKLSKNWLAEKNRTGAPSTIGVWKGSLKQAASDDADIKYSEHAMSWAVNSSADHAGFFNAKRPIFAYTANFIKTISKRALGKFIDLITEVD